MVLVNAVLTLAAKIAGASTVAQVTAGVGLTIASVTGAGTLVIGPQASLQLNAGIAAGQTIAFQGSTGTLTIEAPTSFAGAIAGFGVGDRIALAAAGR